ncbi:1,4-beta-xylanase [Lacibacter sp. H375]|uniref:1,4-beta-xylanase n=1 Tax=Lacibacter sp. H375 TaxID=3133424 RepID=UPI0030C05228
MKYVKNSLCLLLIMFVFYSNAQNKNTQRNIWTKKQANTWYSKQPWFVGANFLPSNAINQLEMWQAETFDTATIAKELKWAAAIGMNTMRVFLHDLAYKQDPQGFKKRIELFLRIANRYKIKPLFVLFDSCWDPFPHAGKQHEPAPFLHNSGWVQSPGADALKDTRQHPRLQKYVTDIVTTFNKDKRVMGWDVWNEPDNTNNSSYGRFEPYNKVELVHTLLKKVFVWTRMANPAQPITAGIWAGNWSVHDSLRPIEKLMIEESDIISFHNYGKAEDFERCINWLGKYERPILCTEYMSRGNGSFFETSLPVAKKYKVAAFNWGLVDGKSQTIYPWDSWDKKYYAEPDLWFHDVFRSNGTPYRQAEIDLIKELTKK